MGFGTGFLNLLFSRSRVNATAILLWGPGRDGSVMGMYIKDSLNKVP